MERQGRTHKWCTLMDPHTWASKGRTTSTNIHSATMWGYRMLSRGPARGDERLGKVAREGQGYPCYQHDMMMMMITVDNVLTYDIILSEFEPQWLYFFHFWKITHAKGINPHFPINGLNNITGVLLRGRFWYYITHEVWNSIKKPKKTFIVIDELKQNV